MQCKRTRVRAPRLRCHFKDTEPKVRRIYRVAGYGDQYQFSLHNNSAVNLERGLAERVYMVKNPRPGFRADIDPAFVPTPQPIPGVFKRLKKYKSQIVKTVGKRAKISSEKFLSYYDGYKLTTYTRAVDSLKERPIQRKDANLKTFVKAEKLNLTLKPDPCPRVIQPRNPRYNVELGRYLRPVEHDIYTAIDRIWGSKTIFKGLNVETMGIEIHKKMRKFSRPCAIGFDASRFDQHVSVEALRFEHSIYKSIFGYPELLTTLLEWQIHNKGTAYASDGYFNYSVDGCRMSGDMNTSLGNCILAALIAKDLVDRLGITAELVNNGDDNVLICSVDDEEVVEKHLYNHWLAYGFEVVAEPPVYCTEQIEFCQMKPVFDGRHYIMVRNPTVSMSKDAYSINPFYNQRSCRKWMRAVGECGMSLTAGIPIKQSYYKSMIRNGEDKGKIHKSKEFNSGLAWWSRNMDRKEREILPSTRYSFWLAFGYTPDEQEAMERYFDKLEFIPLYSESGTPAKAPECLLLQLIPSPPIQPPLPPEIRTNRAKRPEVPALTSPVPPQTVKSTTPRTVTTRQARTSS